MLTETLEIEGEAQVTARLNRSQASFLVATAPDVDVLLVTYNQSAFIERALQSIFQQRYQGRVRVIVADDASSDDTLAVIKKAARAQRKVEFFFLSSDENRGITRNYQRAFAATTAPYVAILEGDDYWSSSLKLAKQIGFLEEQRACVACGSNYFIFDEQNSNCELRRPETTNLTIIPPKLLIRENLPGNFSCCLYRGDVVRNLPPSLFDSTSYDWIVNLCVATRGIFAFIGEPLSVYRRHGDGAWNRLAEADKLKMQLGVIVDYDRITEGRFRDEFAELRKSLQKAIAGAKHNGRSPPGRSALGRVLRAWGLDTLAKAMLPMGLVHFLARRV